jgi:TonB family protein
MDRLSKKCVIGSACLHGTLLLVLAVGPAFLGSSEKVDPIEPINFIPYKTINENLTGGGNPNAPITPPRPSPPAPKPPQAAVKPEPKPEPEPPRPKTPEPPAKPTERPISKPDPESLEGPSKPHKPAADHKPVANLTEVKRPRNPKSPATSDPESQATNAANAQKQKSDQIMSSVERIQDGASRGVSIELRGPGGGGIPYAGFNQALISAYMRAWLVPTEAAEKGAKVTAVITLSRDGRVIESHISSPSGDSDLDNSVQRALYQVQSVAPFPDGTKDTRKTFWLEFDPKAKRLLG